MIEKRAYSPTEVAQILGLCGNTVYKLIRRGDIRAIKFDRKLVIPAKELERVLDSRGALTAKKPQFEDLPPFVCI